MLDDFINLIPDSLLNQPGEVLQSGRQAFAEPSDIYIIGYHPGGNPEEAPYTVGESIDLVLNHRAAEWSAYLDESWDGKPPGSRPLQRRIAHLCGGLGLNPRKVPASHLIFQRWDEANKPSPGTQREWAAECWPFHQGGIEQLGVKILVCLGSYARGWVLKKERETGVEPQRFDSFTAQNKWAWQSYAYQAGNRYILTLTHPTWADWINPNADPTELVKRTLSKVRG